MSDAFIDVNTVSVKSTHFLAAVSLIKEVRKKYELCSENWPIPVFKFGFPKDFYYAEVWNDGMDWQDTYWIIESKNFESPKIQPLLVFDKINKINGSTFKEFLIALLRYRRDVIWIKNKDYEIDNDTIWSFVTRKFVNKEQEKNWKSDLFSLHHASQPLVKFWINLNFIPETTKKPLRLFTSFDFFIDAVLNTNLHFTLDSELRKPHNCIEGPHGREPERELYIGVKNEEKGVFTVN